MIQDKRHRDVIFPKSWMMSINLYFTSGELETNFVMLNTNIREKRRRAIRRINYFVDR